MECNFLKDISKRQARWLRENGKITIYRYRSEGRWVTGEKELTTVNKTKKNKKYKLQENLYNKYFSRGSFVDENGNVIY